MLTLMLSRIPDVVPGLNPNEALVAEERLFPPITSSLIDASRASVGGASSQPTNQASLPQKE